MRERPIIFSGPMVLAVLEGRKTVTRRVMKPQPGPQGLQPDDPALLASCPYGTRGDRLWIKERWRPTEEDDGKVIAIRYAADGTVRRFLRRDIPARWKLPQSAARGDVTPLFMPRWASRLVLERTTTGIDRPAGLSADQIRAEGLVTDQETTPSSRWRDQWISVNGATSWRANPWVWAIGFALQDPKDGRTLRQLAN